MAKSKYRTITQDDYLQLNESLRFMGYRDYSQYLGSSTWAGIRQTVFEANNRCHCGVIATQVHHSRYDAKTMRGECLDYLHPVCKMCHEIEHGSCNGKPIKVLSGGSGFSVAMTKQIKRENRKERKRRKPSTSRRYRY